MNEEMSLVQIRVNTQLKKEAETVFRKIGLDIPTAIRMFFYAAVREQALPVSTNPAITEAEVDEVIQIFRALVMFKNQKPNKDKKRKERGQASV